MTRDPLLPDDDDRFRYFHVAIACEAGRLAELLAEVDHARDAHQSSLRARYASVAPEGWAPALGGQGELVEITTLHEYDAPEYWSRAAATAFLARRGVSTDDEAPTWDTMLRAVRACAIGAPFGLGRLPLSMAAALAPCVLGDARSLGLELGAWVDDARQERSAITSALHRALGESRPELEDALPTREHVEAFEAELKVRVDAYLSWLGEVLARGECVVDLLHRDP